MFGATYDPTNDAFGVDAMPDAAFQASLDAIAPNVVTITADQRLPSESWTDALSRVLPMLAATWQQKQLLTVQVERAKQGLPPLDANQIAAGVNVGLDSSTQKLVMWGGAALLATIVMMSLARRR
jgi:hypothetical protein